SPSLTLIHPRFLSAVFPYTTLFRSLIAWRGRINWFLPFVLRTFWQIFVILDCALGTWRFTLVNRNLISFWRVGVRLGLTVFIPNRHWNVNRVLRAVWVGYHNRPGLIAWRGRINWFLPFVLRTFWQIFVILDCALGTWRFTLVNRNLISFWRVGVRLDLTVFI